MIQVQVRALFQVASVVTNAVNLRVGQLLHTASSSGGIICLQVLTGTLST